MNQLAIFNGALSLVGVRNPLADIQESRPEAFQCRLWYRVSRDFVFRKAYWPTIRRTVALALVSENPGTGPWEAGMPPAPWRFAYAMPADALSIQHLFNAESPSDDNRTFTIERIGATKCVVTQIQHAVATYAQIVEDPNEWDVNLQVAVMHQLAANIALPLTVRPDLQQAIFQLAQFHITQALENSANADARATADPFVDSIQARSGMSVPPMGMR